MALDPDRLDAAVLAFLTERHLATLTTLRADGSPHVVPVGFAYSPDERLVRVISADDSPVTVLIVPTDEELAIAQQALEVARAKR